MYSKDTKSPLFPQNENPNVEPFDPDEELSPEESEGQQVNLG